MVQPILLGVWQLSVPSEWPCLETEQPAFHTPACPGHWMRAAGSLSKGP